MVWDGGIGEFALFGTDRGLLSGENLERKVGYRAGARIGVEFLVCSVG